MDGHDVVYSFVFMFIYMWSGKPSHLPLCVHKTSQGMILYLDN